MKVVILNFSGVYNYEQFSQSPYISHIDCTPLMGTDCYCDEDSANKLRQLLAPYPVKALHFIDSGDYHYVTKFWIERIHHPFSLVVFDHHPDMQPPVWPGVLSCGDWIADVLHTNPMLRHVVCVGTSDQLIKQLPPALRSRVIFYSQDMIDHHQAWPSIAGRVIHEPVYISIDKDVLQRSAAPTDWDNGNMTLQKMEAVLRIIIHHEQIVGIDITGECKANLDLYEEEKEADVNNKTNSELMNLLIQLENNAAEQL